MREYLVEEELEHYRDGWISRREFIRRAVLIGVGAAAATSLARTVQPVRAASTSSLLQTSPFHVDENDPRIESDMIWYPSNDGAYIKAYLAWPANVALNASAPAVVVSHANRGLLPHFMDVARRFAVQGYVALAADQVSRTGTPTDELEDDGQRAAYASLNPEQTARDMVAALEYLKAHGAVNPAKLAATGYCAGGTVTWRVATLAPDLKAAAPFYGTNPPAAAVPNIRAAMLGVYAGLDDRVNAGIPEIEAEMSAAGTTYEIKIYPESMHGFHDDGGNPAYNPVTAPEAWTDTLNWFAQNLGLPAPRV